MKISERIGDLFDKFWYRYGTSKGFQLFIAIVCGIIGGFIGFLISSAVGI